MTIDEDLRKLFQAQVDRATGFSELIGLIPPEVEALKTKWGVTYDGHERVAQIEIRVKKKTTKGIKTHKLILNIKYADNPEQSAHHPSGYEARFEPPVPTRLIQERRRGSYGQVENVYREGFMRSELNPENAQLWIDSGYIELQMTGNEKNPFENACVAQATANTTYELQKLLEFCLLEEKK